jgi:hypothetical protein
MPMELAADSNAIERRSDADRPNKPASNGKLRLMTLHDLDGRTLASRRAKELITTIEDDLGGDLTVSQRQLVQHAAILGAMIESLAARWLLGEPIDQNTYAMLINAQRRVLAAL